MFKEVQQQQQAYGSRVRETPLPLVVSTKFRRKNERFYIQVFNLQECKVRF